MILTYTINEIFCIVLFTFLIISIPFVIELDSMEKKYKRKIKNLYKRIEELEEEKEELEEDIENLEERLVINHELTAKLITDAREKKNAS